MSEPVTHAEIEDVLSSIRRLVSETGRAEEPARPAAKPATRLVLTPALRVPEAEVARSDAAKHDAVQHDAVLHGGAPHSDAVTPRDAAFDAAPEHPQEPMMPQVNGTARNGTATDKITTQTDAADLQDEPRDEAATSGPLDPQGEVPEEAAPERASGTGAETSAQEPSRVLFRASAPVDAPRKPELVRIAPSEAAMVDSFQQNEPVAEAPFVNVDDAEAQTFEESERSAPILLNTKSAPRVPEAERPEAPAAVADSALNEVAADDTAAVDAAGDDAPWRDPEARLYDSLEPGAAQAEQPASAEPQNMQREQSSRVAAVVRRIAELEPAGRAEPEVADQSSRRVPDINEDEIEAVPHSGPTVETIQWEDHQEEASGGASFASARDSVAENAREMAGDALTEAAMDRLAAHEDFLDEEGLRELVSDIVREELQGALGERITRNVRKLVRREIQRALATQELL